MKYIELTQGYKSLVDDDKFEFLSQWKWHISGSGYAVRRPYIGGGRSGQKSATIRMHRLLTEVPDELFVDHINGDKLDNRVTNLRIVTLQQNAFNQRKRSKKSSSKYLGVHWDNHARKWQSQICINGKSIYLGIFDNEEDAAVARDKAALLYYGEIAKLNFSQ